MWETLVEIYVKRKPCDAMEFWEQKKLKFFNIPVKHIPSLDLIL